MDIEWKVLTSRGIFEMEDNATDEEIEEVARMLIAQSLCWNRVEET